jgi:hypothetical protein
VGGSVGGVHSAARYTLLIGVILACTAAARASATPAPTLFRLSVVATTHAEWDHTGGPVPAGDCERTIRSEGFRDVRFRTAKPTLVRIAGGRVSAATIRGLMGTLVLSGANTLSDACDLENKEAIQDCARTRRTFRATTVGVSSARPGSVSFGPARHLRLRTSDCPQEPAEIVRTPLGPIPSPLSIAALSSRRVAHLTVTASVSRRVGFGPVERGTLLQRSTWKVTFDRVQP